MHSIKIVQPRWLHLRPRYMRHVRRYRTCSQELPKRSASAVSAVGAPRSAAHETGAPPGRACSPYYASRASQAGVSTPTSGNPPAPTASLQHYNTASVSASVVSVSTAPPDRPSDGLDEGESLSEAHARSFGEELEPRLTQMLAERRETSRQASTDQALDSEPDTTARTASTSTASTAMCHS